MNKTEMYIAIREAVKNASYTDVNTVYHFLTGMGLIGDEPVIIEDPIYKLLEKMDPAEDGRFLRQIYVILYRHLMKKGVLS